MGTPTTIVEKDGQKHVIIGFRKAELEKLLEG